LTLYSYKSYEKRSPEHIECKFCIKTEFKDISNKNFFELIDNSGVSKNVTELHSGFWTC